MLTKNLSLAKQFHRIITTITSFMIAAVSFPAIWINSFAENEKLSPGEWEGSFLTHDSTLYKMKFIVSYDDKSGKAPVKIKMINLDLDPV